MLEMWGCASLQVFTVSCLVVIRKSLITAEKCSKLKIGLAVLDKQFVVTSSLLFQLINVEYCSLSSTEGLFIAHLIIAG